MERSLASARERAERAGFPRNCRAEHTPHLALHRAKAEKSDVRLLDIGLPEMDGNEFVRRPTAEPETALALFTAVTGYGQEHDRLKTAASGFDHHLVKPVDIVKLENLLG